jgi:hypothetical protein
MVRTALVFIHVTSIGIVFLMTVKPPLGASLIAMATAAGAGLLAALTRFGRPVSPPSVVSA